MSRTERLIERLVSDLEPVRRIPPLRVVAGAIALGAIAAAALAVWLLGLRPDVRALEPGAPYLGIIVGLALFAAGGLGVALGAAVPGRMRVRRLGYAGLGLALAVWAGAGVGLALGGAAFGPLDAEWVALSLHCLGLAALVGVLPALLLVQFVLGAYTQRASLAIASGAAGMVAAGSLAVHLTCVADEVAHVGLAHVAGPILAGVLLGRLVLALARREPAAPETPS